MDSQPQDIHAQSLSQSSNPAASDYTKTARGQSTGGPPGKMGAAEQDMDTGSQPPQSRVTGLKANEALGEMGEEAGIAEADAEQAVLAGRSPGVQRAAGVAAATASARADEARYTVEQLTSSGAAELPGVDFAHRERHLSDTDFSHLFNMSRDQFYQMPMWQQQAMKKKHKLF